MSFDAVRKAFANTASTRIRPYLRSSKLARRQQVSSLAAPKTRSTQDVRPISWQMAVPAKVIRSSQRDLSSREPDSNTRRR